MAQTTRIYAVRRSSAPAVIAHIERAMDRIFILHADHEQNASTSTVAVASPEEAYAAAQAGISIEDATSSPQGTLPL